MRAGKIALQAGAPAAALALPALGSSNNGLDGNGKPKKLSLLTPLTLSMVLGPTSSPLLKDDPGVIFMPPGCVKGAAAWLHYVLRDTAGDRIQGRVLARAHGRG